MTVPQEQEVNPRADRESVELPTTRESESVAQIMAQDAWGPKKAETHKVGQIDSIKIPEGWDKSGAAGNSQGASYSEFQAPGSSSRMEFYYRGQRVSPDEGQNLKGLLKQDGHELSDKEFQSLGSILRGKDDQTKFELDRAWVSDVNSKPVLMVEGRYPENDKKTLTMLVDSDGTGTAVQELSLTTPAAEFDKQKSAFEKSLKSIRWKQ